MPSWHAHAQAQVCLYQSLINKKISKHDSINDFCSLCPCSCPCLDDDDDDNNKNKNNPATFLFTLT